MGFVIGSVNALEFLQTIGHVCIFFSGERDWIHAQTTGYVLFSLAPLKFLREEKEPRGPVQRPPTVGEEVPSGQTGSYLSCYLQVRGTDTNAT